MRKPFQDRTDLASGLGVKKMPGSGHVERFEWNGVHLYASSGATTTAVACPPFTSLPIGFTFTIDNTNGSGDFTLDPSSGSTLTVSAGALKTYTVGASGVPQET